MTTHTYPQELKPLTSLRFIAAFWVLLYHFKDHLGLGMGQFGLVADGYLGVDLFFTLSGFILAHVYLTSFEGGRFGYGGFLKNRIARVYPMHLAALGAMLVLFAGAAMLGVGESNPDASPLRSARASADDPRLGDDAEPGQSAQAFSFIIDKSISKGNIHAI